MMILQAVVKMMIRYHGRVTLKWFLFLLAVATLLGPLSNSSYAHRYFDSWSARWTTPDPALNENPQVLMKKYGYALFETSPHMYTHDNPLRYADPNGKRGFDMIGGPIIPSTSWKEFEYRFVGTAAEAAAVALVIYAPRAAAAVASWWAQNPAAANQTANTVIDALSPAPGATEVELKAGMTLTKLDGNEIKLSDHAVTRMLERGVSFDEAKGVVEKADPFQYLHEGVVKTGYYDPSSKVFLGEAKGNITTVMTKVKPQYIQNLKETIK